MDTKGERGGGGKELGDWGGHIYTIDTMYKMDSWWEHAVEHRELTHLVLCDDLNGREVQKGGDICMCMADSFCCAVEANTTL